MSTRIKVTAGDDREFAFTVYKGDGVTVEDLTGATFAVLAKRSIADADSAAVITGSAVVDGTPTDGNVLVTFPAADTAAFTRTTILWFDVQMTLNSKKRTVLAGKVVIVPQVVRA